MPNNKIISRMDTMNSTASSNNNYLDSQLKQAALEAESDFDEHATGYVYNDDDNLENAPTVDEALIHGKQIMGLFLDNKFDEAFEECSKYEKISLYHSHIKCFLRFLFAIFSLEPHDIKEGREQIKLTLSLCQSKRKSNSIVNSLSSIIWRPNYDEFTDMEVHAELVYAELQVLQTMLTFFGEQSIIALIKGAFRMRSANNAYKYCADILEHKKIWESTLSQSNFDSGVNFGDGCINLILSHLPTRILKLLAIAGFYGDHDQAMRELHHVTDNCKSSARYEIGSLFLRTYNLYVEQIFGAGIGDLQWAETLVMEELKAHPGGCFGLFHAGRLEAVKGENPQKAIEYFERCLQIDLSWKNLINISFWDLIWCYAIQGDWENAAKFAIKMRDNCNWSPATNQYQYACFLLMIYERQKSEAAKKEITSNDEAGNSKPEINELEIVSEEMINEAMKKVPELKVRFAGKTIPPEKYAITKANRFLDTPENLRFKEVLFPAYELFYVWNIFGYAKGCPKFSDKMMNQVSEKLEEHKNDLGDGLPLDTYCYLLLIKGVICRIVGKYKEAISCFEIILENENQIQKDTYIPPHAAFELGLTLVQVDDLIGAKSWLEKARDNYTGFLIESMVHLRVHGALQCIKKLEMARADKLPKKPSLFRRVSSNFLSRSNNNRDED